MTQKMFIFASAFFGVASGSYVPQCVTTCEREFILRVNYHLPDSQDMLDAISTGDMIFNGTVAEIICNAYIPIRTCRHTCKDSIFGQVVAKERLTSFEKLCVRKNYELMREMPCYERVSRLFDPVCLQRCHCRYHKCGAKWKLFHYAQDWVRTINSPKDFYRLSRVLHRLCGLTTCQLLCQVPLLLNYCTPEAAFTLEEFAGTPMVPMARRMKQINGYDYFPDSCRELARKATSTTLLRTNFCFLVFLLQFNIMFCLYF